MLSEYKELIKSLMGSNVVKNSCDYIFLSTSEDAPIKHKKSIYRESVLAILQHPTADSYLCINSKKRNYMSFITGGIETDESIIQAAKREVVEESGYCEFENVLDLQFSMFNYFYAKNSDVNKLVKYNIVYIKLASLKNLRNG